MWVLLLIKYSSQIFDEAIYELRQKDQGARGGYFH